jgi:zinc D-Ala-D-Ala carboxypeptidase
MRKTQITENFTLEEVKSRDTGALLITDLLYHHMDKLQEMREEIGRIDINSGYRTPEHNKSVGGAENSMHLQFATDIRPTGVGLDMANEIAEDLGFSGIGRYKTFLHLDCREFIDRPSARWDER